MDVGVHLVNFDFDGGPAAIRSVLIESARMAESGGLTNISVMDHYLQMDVPGLGGPLAPMLEGYTTLGFLAGQTQSVELQLLVTGVTYRHPALLAKIVTTLDVLSGGRAMLGIGAAWYEREHRAYGVPFPPLAERFERLEETLQIVHQMWGPNDGPYEGRHYQLAESVNSPQPLRIPPIMIGGGGERKTLRLVAQYAQACNLFADASSDPAALAHKLDVLRDHCQRAGTDPTDIRKTLLWTGAVDDHLITSLRPLADLGFTEVHIMAPPGDPVAFIERLGTHVVPALRDLN